MSPSAPLTSRRARLGFEISSKRAISCRVLLTGTVRCLTPTQPHWRSSRGRSTMWWAKSSGIHHGSPRRPACPRWCGPRCRRLAEARPCAKRSRSSFHQACAASTFRSARSGGADGEVVAIVTEAVDITERRLAEEHLRQSQKLEAMGQLTGGVAHDFNNLLTPIIGSLDMLLRSGVGSERERRLMNGGMKSAERARTLVQRLLAFSRRQPLQVDSVDVASLIAGMAELLASTLGPRI